MATYRVLGTTDDITDCQREGCSKSGLRMTVMLGILDADGNVEEVVYYGSECASLVVGKPGARIRHEAQAADAKQAREQRDREYRARLILDTYACVEAGETREIRIEAAQRFWALHPALRRKAAAGEVHVSAREQITKMLAEARAVLPDHQPDMALHDPRAFPSSHGRYDWSCKCGRRTDLRYDSLAAAEAGARADHDETPRPVA